MSKLKEFAEFLIEVEKNGGNYQWLNTRDNVWIDNNLDSDSLDYYFFSKGRLRIKPKEEERVKIPLEFGDVTPNTIFRLHDSSESCKYMSFYTPVCAQWNGVTMRSVNSVSDLCFYYYDDQLIKYWEYSTDNGKTWEGCWKYE